MITVYQIRLSNADIDAANAGGVGANVKTDVRCQMMFGASKWKDEYVKFYSPVYEVDTDDLEDAFNSTNLWDDDKVRRLARGSSTSVGDIFVKDGNAFIVDSFGFEDIGKLNFAA